MLENIAVETGTKSRKGSSVEGVSKTVSELFQSSSVGILIMNEH